jgi:hypothetical protein
MRPVSCLKCAFLRGSFEDGRKTYRCKVKESRIVNVNNQIKCSRFQEKKKKTITKKETGSKGEVYPDNYFDAESLYKSMIEKREGN